MIPIISIEIGDTPLSEPPREAAEETSGPLLRYVTALSITGSLLPSQLKAIIKQIHFFPYVIV